MSPLSILIADDQIDNAESLAMLATIWGHEVHVCQDYESTLECCIKHLPDVVLLDLGFPRLTNGFRIAREIKACSLLDDVTLIAITGYSDKDTRKSAREAGCDHYLVKPADPVDLEILLKSIQASVVYT